MHSTGARGQAQLLPQTLYCFNLLQRLNNERGYESKEVGAQTSKPDCLGSNPSSSTY